MPSGWSERRRQRARTCPKPFRWSTSRGSCRLAPGHEGPCKPGGPFRLR